MKRLPLHLILTSDEATLILQAVMAYKDKRDDMSSWKSDEYLVLEGRVYAAISDLKYELRRAQ